MINGLVGSGVGQNIFLELAKNVSGWEVVADDKDAAVETEALAHAQLARAPPNNLSKVTSPYNIFLRHNYMHQSLVCCRLNSDEANYSSTQLSSSNCTRTSTYNCAIYMYGVSPSSTRRAA